MPGSATIMRMDIPSLRSAYRLRRALGQYGIAADVHGGRRIALVSVWVDLVVWCNGFAYHWWNGEYWEKTGSRKYTFHTADNPVTAARRVAQRYAELRATHPLSPALAEALSPPPRRCPCPIHSGATGEGTGSRRFQARCADHDPRPMLEQPAGHG